MYRVVFDPIVMLRGLLNPHSICGLLFFEYADRYRVLFSDDTVRAVQYLIYHPFVVMAIVNLTKIRPARVARILLRAQRVSIPDDFAVPHESIFVTLARAARADYFVCADPKYLDKRDQLGVPVLDVASFLSLVEPNGLP